MGEWGVTVLEASGDVDAGESGNAHLPDARRRQEQPVPPRGAPRAISALVEAMGKLDDASAPHAAPRRSALAGQARALMAGRPCDRLDVGRTDRGGPQDQRRRGPPRRARQDRGRGVPPLRRPPRAGLRGRPGTSSPRAMARSAGRPSTARSGSRTSSAGHADGDVLQAPGRAGLAHAGPRLRRARGPGRGARADPGRPHLRDIVYEEPRASATCTSTSTTAR